MEDGGYHSERRRGESGSSSSIKTYTVSLSLNISSLSEIKFFFIHRMRCLMVVASFFLSSMTSSSSTTMVPSPLSPPDWWSLTGENAGNRIVCLGWEEKRRCNPPLKGEGVRGTLSAKLTANVKRSSSRTIHSITQSLNHSITQSLKNRERR